MRRSGNGLRGRLLLGIFAAGLGLLVADAASACSVCFGDPNSSMSQGAQAGVLVLLGVIVAVLAGLASLIVFWARRAAKLALPEAPAAPLEG
ncbi:MAG: hypothetical protein VX466_09450 [Myxococcota bacterium]|nr:hypothetical protein [Myxococcota bacterium]